MVDTVITFVFFDAETEAQRRGAPFICINVGRSILIHNVLCTLPTRPESKNLLYSLCVNPNSVVIVIMLKSEQLPLLAPDCVPLTDRHYAIYLPQ